MLRAEGASDEEIVAFLARFGADALWGAPRERLRTYLSNLESTSAEGVAMITDVDAPVEGRLQRLALLTKSAPHPALLPILTEIVTAGEEDDRVRSRALTAVNAIPHRSVVRDLIEYLDDPVLRFRACEQLKKITGLAPPYSEGDVSGLKSAFQEWWVRHEATFVHDRRRVLREY